LSRRKLRVGRWLGGDAPGRRPPLVKEKAACRAKKRKTTGFFHYTITTCINYKFEVSELAWHQFFIE